MLARVAIVGNSAAALSALERFRQYDRQTPVTVVSAEPGVAYSRVLLPYYLGHKIHLRGLFIRTSSFYKRMGVELISGSSARVEEVDTASRRLKLASGRYVGFDKLLIASGSRPTRPPIPGIEHPAVHELWTLRDAVELEPLLRKGARMLVIGSGFVALQAAWVGYRRGLFVTVVELERRIMPRVLDEPAARLLSEAIGAHSVSVHTGTHTEGLEEDGRGGVRVYTRELGPLAADVVVVATGVRPNDALLAEALEPGLAGIPVDRSMATVVDGVFAAGDVARGPTALGGPLEIHALWPTAVEQGKVAGANLAGAGLVYGGSLSMNVTEMFGYTVVSLGRIFETSGERVNVYRELRGVKYLKVLEKDGVPVGAVALGDPETASRLGQLRPLIRQRRGVKELQAILEEGLASRQLSDCLPRPVSGRYQRLKEA
jgi:NAD(P)H-nitrite reductase large subunit